MGHGVMLSSTVVFEFKVNKSFRRYSCPITIPVDGHSELRRLHLDEPEYRIIYPKGEEYVAKMQHERPGQPSEYYQLIVPKRNQRLPDYLKGGDRLIVVLTRPRDKNLAILEYVLRHDLQI